MEVFYEDDDIRMWEEDNIIFFEYNCKVVTLEIAKRSIEPRLQLMNGRKMPLVLFLDRIKYAHVSAMKYTSGDPGTRNITASAIVVKNKVQEIIARCFLLITPPTLPIYVTHNKEAAIARAKKYTGKSLHYELEKIFKKK